MLRKPDDDAETAVAFEHLSGGLSSDRDLDEVYTCPPREYLFSPTDDGLTVVNLVLGNELVHVVYGSGFDSAGSALAYLSPAVVLYPVAQISAA